MVTWVARTMVVSWVVDSESILILSFQNKTPSLANSCQLKTTASLVARHDYIEFELMGYVWS